jgi:two-component system chemotaxis response regulator CheB
VEAGALAMLPRPAGPGHPDHLAQARELVQTIKLMAEVKVVRRWARPRPSGNGAGPTASAPSTEPPAATGASMRNRITLVAMGASTGGPLALQTVLGGLPANFPVPIVIVQHIAAGFVQGFAEWLAQTCQRPVRLAQDQELLLAGQTYIAPDGYQLKVMAGGRVALTTDPPENGLRPAVSYLFRSVAAVYGPNAIGVLLTGMGRDGADGLKLMRTQGAVTLVQDEASSVVHGMPGEAIRLDAADYVLSLQAIQTTVTNLVMRR